MQLSAVLAVRDEERMLDGALRSLAFCDEIVVVVDDRSADATEAIARRYTDKVIVAPFEDYAQIRNIGIDAAEGEWILHIDADERITPDLARELPAALAQAGPDILGFQGRTINFFWGRRMEHGGWGDMWQPRVLRRQQRFGGRVHEAAGIPPERLGRLEGERWHFTHRSIEEGLQKTIQYGRFQSQDEFESGAPRVTVRKLIRVMALEFGRRMIRRRGYRDGMPGFVEAVFQPFALFCAQVMLWERQQGDAVERAYAELEREVAGDEPGPRS
jgi:(heptosyl)LPS beta-1,4-glucosyltransferase